MFFQIADLLASALVLLTGLYLLGLGALSLAAPEKASRFLLGFANSATGHYLELLIRFLVGAAFLLHSRHMLYSAVFALFGWVLIGTTAVLAVVPWRWHQRFAQRSVPQALRHLKLVAIASLLLGGTVLAAHALGAG
jgi:hypothetical protein